MTVESRLYMYEANAEAIGLMLHEHQAEASHYGFELVAIVADLRDENASSLVEAVASVRGDETGLADHQRRIAEQGNQIPTAIVVLPLTAAVDMLHVLTFHSVAEQLPKAVPPGFDRVVVLSHGCSLIYANIPKVSAPIGDA